MALVETPEELETEISTDPWRDFVEGSKLLKPRLQ